MHRSSRDDADLCGGGDEQAWLTATMSETAYSITSAALASDVGCTSIPSELADFGLKLDVE